MKICHSLRNKDIKTQEEKAAELRSTESCNEQEISEHMFSKYLYRASGAGGQLLQDIRNEGCPEKQGAAGTNEA